MNRPRLIAASCAIVAAAIALSVLVRHRHPDFGFIRTKRVYESGAPNGWVLRAAEAIGIDSWGSKHLNLDGGPLHWSSGSFRDRFGWLYFSHQMGQEHPDWEFAALSQTRLEDVSAAELNPEFIRAGDEAIPSVFHTGETGNIYNPGSTRIAVAVFEGQVIGVRKLSDSDTIYVVELTEQGGDDDWGNMRFRYVTISWENQ